MQTSTIAAANRSLSEKTSACSDHVTKRGAQLLARQHVRAEIYQCDGNGMIRACREVDAKRQQT
jgi:hypothetical protein